MTRIERLADADRAAWQRLAEGYKRFYETELPPEQYDIAWQRLRAGDGIHAWAAHLDGRLVGIVHYLFHTSAWAPEVCYLQDLFVDEAARGQGAAAALIARVADSARERGAARLYWLTHRDNHRARALYDRVASHVGFIRYDLAMG